MCAIQNHIKRALQSTGRILVPNDLIQNLRSISRNFRKARQEDAHEYMVNLLESMHKCCLPSGMSSDSPSAYEISLVHKIFGGRLRSQVKCMRCSYCSNTFDPFLDLSLEIVKADSLPKALTHFTAVEQLDGGERQYQCQRCRQKVKALKQLTVHKPPYVLSIHLKRFGSHAPGIKIDKKVEFGSTLDLKPFVSNSNDGELKYTLYGVLVHAGWSTHSGHYFCFVKTSSGMWHSLDDNRVVQVSERTVLQQKAYMLFYVRDRKIPAPKWLVERKEILPSDNEKGDMHASVKPKETFQRSLIAAGLQAVDSFKKPRVKESCIINIPKSSVMAGSFSCLKDPISQSSSKALVKDCAVEQSLNGAELHTQSIHLSVVIDKFNIQNDSEGERSLGEHSFEKAEDNGLSLEGCDPDEQFIKSRRRKECVQKALGDNCSLPKVLKPKKKVMKLRVATVHLSSRFLIKAPLSLYKNKRKQKTKECQSLEVTSLIGKDYMKDSISAGLEPSKPSDLVSTHRKMSKRKSCTTNGSFHRTAKDVKPSEMSLTNISESSSRERIYLKNAVLPSLEQHRQCSSIKYEHLDCDTGEPNTSHMKQSFCEDGLMSTLTRGVEEFTVARWDEIEISPSQIAGPEKGQNINIGYVPDEWDEEYDRGKRRKVRNPKDSFSGSNPFQEIATKKAKLRK